MPVVELVEPMHPVRAIIGSSFEISLHAMQTHCQKERFEEDWVLPPQLGSLLPPETRNCKKSCQFQWQKMSLKHCRLALLLILQW